MRYRFLEDEATADVAFEAWGRELADLFKAAADAVIAVMVENPTSIKSHESREFNIDNDRLDLLLYSFLEQLIYYKDAEHFLGNISHVEINSSEGQWHAYAQAKGERLDPSRHHQRVDVKAVTLHDFRLRKEQGRWRAHVILDI